MMKTSKTLHLHIKSKAKEQRILEKGQLLKPLHLNKGKILSQNIKGLNT